MSSDTIPIVVQFSYVTQFTNPLNYFINLWESNSGGLELMFSNKATPEIKLPSQIPGTSEPSDIRYLLKYLCDKFMTDARKELFVVDDSM